MRTIEELVEVEKYIVWKSDTTMLVRASTPTKLLIPLLKLGIKLRFVL